MNTTSCHKEAQYICGQCTMVYTNYKHLLEHLYWRHGTESSWCNKCTLKRWRYAVHVCHVLPIYCEQFFEEEEEEEEVHLEKSMEDEMEYRETDYCTCGKFIEGAAMIGCDGPNCPFEWYHFTCVGVMVAPKGNWLCPLCIAAQK